MLTKSFSAGCISALASAISLSQPKDELSNLYFQQASGDYEDFPAPLM